MIRIRQVHPMFQVPDLGCVWFLCIYIILRTRSLRTFVFVAYCFFLSLAGVFFIIMFFPGARAGFGCRVRALRGSKPRGVGQSGFSVLANILISSLRKDSSAIFFKLKSFFPGKYFFEARIDFTTLCLIETLRRAVCIRSVVCYYPSLGRQLTIRILLVLVRTSLRERE